MIRIVHETLKDFDAREALLHCAFGEARFSRTCERLREERLPAKDMAFLMKDETRLIGTLRLWNITAGPRRPSLLLGPVAIDADYQGQGLGNQLISHAISAAANAGHHSIVLVGDAPYYARFGFDQALTDDLWLPGPVDRARFLGLELVDGALSGATGLVSATGALQAKPDLGVLLRCELTHDPQFASAA